MLEDKCFDVRRIKEIHLIERIETVKSPKDALELARIKEIHLIERIETTMIYYHFTTAHLRIKEIHLIERIETAPSSRWSELRFVESKKYISLRELKPPTVGRSGSTKGKGRNQRNTSH